MICEFLNGRFEVFFAIYFFVRQAGVPLIVEYIRAVKYGLAILPDSVDLQTTPLQIRSRVDMALHRTCQANGTSPAMLNIGREVEIELTKIFLVEYVSGLFMVYLMGVRSDATGRRRFLLGAPLYGLAALWLGFVLDFYLQPGTLTFIYAGSIASGLTGGDGTVRIAMTAFVSDASPVEKRTRSLVVMEILRQVAAATASLGVATWFNTKGFEPCIWLGFAFTVLLLKFVTLIMDESNPLDREFRSGNLWGVVAGLDCRNHQTLVNRFYVMALVGCGCFAFVESGFFISAIVVVERAPLCATSLVSWYYIGGLQALSVAGLLLVIIMTHFLDDYKIGLVGVTSALAGGIFMGFSSHSWQLFVVSRRVTARLFMEGSMVRTSGIAIFKQTSLVAALLLFHAVPFPIFLSIASKHIEPQKRAVAFAFMSICQTTAVYIAFLVYLPLTSASFFILNAPVFFVGVLFLLIPLVIFGVFVLTSTTWKRTVGVRDNSCDGSEGDLKQDYQSDSS